MIKVAGRGDFYCGGQCIWSTGAWREVVTSHLSSLQLLRRTEPERVRMWAWWASVHVNFPTTWTMFDSCSQLSLFEQQQDQFSAGVGLKGIILGCSHPGRLFSLLCANVYFVVFMVHFTSHWHIKSKSEPVQHPLLNTRAVITTNKTKTRIRFWVTHETKRGWPAGLRVKGAFTPAIWE